jgi:general secretion pathway protein G
METIVKQTILGILDRMMTVVRRRKVETRGQPNGFTLVELLVVLAILGLVAAVATPQVLKYLAKAKTDTARIDIKGIGVALDLFLLDTGHYPTEQEGLAVLVERPNNGAEWHGPYLKSKRVPLDPWVRPYIYHFPGQHGDYDLFTFGADNAPGGAGENQDVVNW